MKFGGYDDLLLIMEIISSKFYQNIQSWRLIVERLLYIVLIPVESVMVLMLNPSTHNHNVFARLLVKRTVFWAQNFDKFDV